MTHSEKNEASIELDGYTQGQVFHPGQVVTGKVIYDIRKEQDDIRDVAIEFKGKIKTTVVVSNGQSTQRHTERIILFSFRESLFLGNYTAKSQTLAWPFEFRFPDTVLYDRTSESADARFATSGPVSPPPSFEQKCGRGTAYISYKLKARINGTRIFHRHKPSMNLTLRPLAPGLPSPQIVGQFSLGRHEWQSRKLRDHKHTFGEKMKHVFTSDETLRNPSINFDTMIQLPSGTTGTQRSDLLLSLTQSRAGITDPESPKLVLGDVNIWLQGMTSMRVHRPISHSSYHEYGKVLETWALFKAPQVPLAERPALDLDGTPRIIAKNWALADFEGVYTAIANPRVPDFLTWTVAHSHRFKVEVVVIHPETGHQWKLEAKIPVFISPENDRGPRDVQQVQRPLVTNYEWSVGS